MSMYFRKTVALAVLAGLLGASAATPAAADGWGRPGWGYGGWGYRHGGWRSGGAAAAAAVGGLALGVAAAGAMSQPGYGYGYSYGGCYPVDRPVVDGWGNVIGYRRVEVCD